MFDRLRAVEGDVCEQSGFQNQLLTFQPHNNLSRFDSVDILLEATEGDLQEAFEELRVKLPQHQEAILKEHARQLAAGLVGWLRRLVDNGLVAVLVDWLGRQVGSRLVAARACVRTGWLGQAAAGTRAAAHPWRVRAARSRQICGPMAPR